MAAKKSTIKKRKRATLKENLEYSLAEQRVGKTVVPFSTAAEAMKFLYSYQNFIILLEKAFREAAELGKRYDPRALSWMIDLETPTIEEKLRAHEHVKT